MQRDLDHGQVQRATGQANLTLAARHGKLEVASEVQLFAALSHPICWSFSRGSIPLAILPSNSLASARASRVVFSATAPTFRRIESRLLAFPDVALDDKCFSALTDEHRIREVPCRERSTGAKPREVARQ